MAQVYSVNSVGYINLNMLPGLNAICNQLNTGGNSLNEVLPLPADMAGCQVFSFINNNYLSDIYDGTAWLDNATGDPSVRPVAPGKGFFFSNETGSPRTVTFVGEVPQGTTLTVAIPQGLRFSGPIVPQELSLTMANGFPQIAGLQFLTYNRATQGFDSLINDGTQWLDNDTGDPADARPLVGQGFFTSNSDTTDYSWVRCFNVNTPCP
jgi:hypothetical protein